MKALAPGSILAAFALLGLSACGSHGSPAAPSAPAAAATPVPTVPPTPVPSPAPSPPPIGSLRVEPPAGPGHIITIPAGGEVRIHGNPLSVPDDVTLVLFADWGDGTRGRIYCGPCRLQHVYGLPGSFHLVSTLVGPSAAVSRSWTVEVSP